MRIYPVLAFTLLLSSSAAFADAKSYCEQTATEFANGQTSDVDQWQTKFRSAVSDCMAQYEPPNDATTTASTDPVVETPAAPLPPKKKKKQAAVKQDIPAEPIPVAEKPEVKKKPAEGSAEWVQYCDSKYTSFNKETGTYKSWKGITRKCRVTSKG